MSDTEDDTYKKLWESQKSKSRKLEQENDELRDDLEKIEDEVSLVKKKLTNATKQNEELVSENDLLRAEVAKLRAKVKESHDKMSDLEAQVEQMTLEKSRLLRQAHRSQSEDVVHSKQNHDEIEKQKLRIEELEDDLHDAKEEVKSLNNSKQILKDEIDHLEAEVQILEKEKEELVTKQPKTSPEETIKLKQEIDLLQDKITGLQHHVQQEKEKREIVEQDLEAERTKRQELESSLKSLSSSTDSHPPASRIEIPESHTEKLTSLRSGTSGPSGRRAPTRRRADTVTHHEGLPKVHISLDFASLVKEADDALNNSSINSSNNSSGKQEIRERSPSPSPRPPHPTPPSYTVLEGTVPGFTFSNKVSNSNILSDQLKKIDRFWQLKGKKRVKTIQVEKSMKSMNSGDVFILETPTKIFQWNGKESNRIEKAKGKDIVTKIQRQTWGEKPQYFYIEEGEESDEMNMFWKEMGCHDDVMKSAVEGGEDGEFENNCDKYYKLYRVPESGNPQEIVGKIQQSMIETKYSYVLDAISEIFVWIGKESGKNSRAAALEFAEFILANPPPDTPLRPSFCQIFRSGEGGEYFAFCEKFPDWKELDVSLGPSKIVSNVAKSKKQDKIDVIYLDHVDPVKYHQAILAQQEEGKNVFHENGKVQIWVVTDKDKVDIGSDKYGQFWAGNSFVVQYSYGGNDGSEYKYVYFWQGRESSKLHIRLTTAHCLDLTKNSKASQIRVVAGKESENFLKIFKGKLVVHKGNVIGYEPAVTWCMYQIRGTPLHATACVAVQVEMSFQLLNSRDIFLVKNGKKAYCWVGKFASKTLVMEATNDIAPILEKDIMVTTIHEGEEPEDFWKIQDKPSNHFEIKQNWTPKVFLFNPSSGQLSADIIYPFSEEDLITENLVLVDDFHRIFVWIGAKAKEGDKKTAFETAIEYHKLEESKRKVNIALELVSEGQETPDFAACFHGWRKPICTQPTEKLDIKEQLEEYSRVYTYEELKRKDLLPKTVDKSVLENYLSEEEFARVFGMDRETWSKLPSWKQVPKKKEVNLY